MPKGPVGAHELRIIGAMRDATPITRRLLVEGRVQGVAYRASMVAEARRLGVHGWVRNLHDGRVEAVVQGPTEAVQALIDWARRGPPLARVARLDVEPAEGGQFDRFLQEKSV